MNLTSGKILIACIHDVRGSQEREASDLSTDPGKKQYGTHVSMYAKTDNPACRSFLTDTDLKEEQNARMRSGGEPYRVVARVGVHGCEEVD